jgi:hypothetical protein
MCTRTQSIQVGFRQKWVGVVHRMIFKHHRKINPSKVFDLTLPLDRVAKGYRAIKALLLP